MTTKSLYRTSPVNSNCLAEDKNYDFHQVKKMNYGRTLTKEIVNDEGKNIRILTSEDEVQPVTFYFLLCFLP